MCVLTLGGTAYAFRAPLLQRVFKFDQSVYLRDVEYYFVVRATNNFGESDNSGDADVDIP